MSIRVELTDLPRHIIRRGGGFLLTSIMDSRPHVAHLPFQVAAADGQVQLRARVGRTSYANCERRTSVTVLWPSPLTPEDALNGWDGDEPDLDRYSLIVDGEARLDGPDHVIVSVTDAIFHRPVQRHNPSP